MGFSQSKPAPAGADSTSPGVDSTNSGRHLTLQSTVTLANGVKMPRLGFGVWQVAAAVCTQTCLDALAAGYRHIDSAQYYGNEAEVGAALAATDVPRKDAFVNTKIGEEHGSVEANYESLLGSVRKIAGDGNRGEGGAYVDLFLIHSPRMGPEGIQRLWTALERLLEEGKTRSIGVSNFDAAQIEAMRLYAKVWPPHVNQIELNPWNQERDIVAYCAKHNIVLQAYSPLARGQDDRLADATLGRVAAAVAREPAQVLIRYCLQKGWVPLPKTTHRDRMVSNTQVYDFVLGPEQMAALDGLDGLGVGDVKGEGKGYKGEGKGKGYWDGKNG